MKTTIGTKLMAASAAMFALTALLGYTGLNSLSTFNAGFDTVADKTTRKIELATAMDDAQSEMMSAQNGIVLGAFAKDPAEISTNEQSFRKYAERIRKITEELSPMLITAESKGLTKDAEARLGEWLPLFEDLLRAANGENASEADRIRRQLTAPVMEKLGADVTRLQQIEREVLARDKAALAEEYSHSWTVSAVLMALLARFRILVWAGGALLGWVAGDIMATDPVLAKAFGEMALHVLHDWGGPLGSLIVIGIGYVIVRRHRHLYLDEIMAGAGLVLWIVVDRFNDAVFGGATPDLTKIWSVRGVLVAVMAVIYTICRKRWHVEKMEA